MGISDFHFLRQIGEGGFGKVHIAANKKSGGFVAIKEIYGQNNTEHEVNILQIVNHKNIIKYFEHFYSLNRNLMIVFEYAYAGNFESFYHPDMNEPYIWSCIADIASALEYLHNLKPRHILHRDLKPANVLGFFNWDQPGNFLVWKIADFGISKLFGEDTQRNYYTASCVGTGIYMAPEALAGEEYTFSADIWSFGAVISFCCNGTHLFMNSSLVKYWKLSDPLPSYYSLELKKLISQMLNPDRKLRPNASVILGIVPTQGI